MMGESNHGYHGLAFAETTMSHRLCHTMDAMLGRSYYDLEWGIRCGVRFVKLGNRQGPSTNPATSDSTQTLRDLYIHSS